MRYAWIKEQRGSYPVRLMCRALQVSKSGYYKWLSSPASPRAARSQAIRRSVREVYEQFKGIYGSPKITAELQNRDDLETACRNTVAKAMKEMGLKSRVSKQFKPTTTKSDPNKRPAANVLGQNFATGEPNRKWAADITYLPVDGGWVYLAVVIDLFSRKVVGWSISNRLTTPLVTKAMRNAIETRRPQADSLIHHSDQGCQYTSDAFQQILATLGITCSMSRTGCCYDNAVVERFFWSLKHEWTKFERFNNLEQARWSVFKYIETFYNPHRIHKALNYQSPNQFEENYQQNLAA